MYVALGKLKPGKWERGGLCTDHALVTMNHLKFTAITATLVSGTFSLIFDFKKKIPKALCEQHH